MQLYVHDFSEFWSDRPEGELGEDGRFDPYPLDDYWTDASHIPLLLRVSGRLAGFALVRRLARPIATVERVFVPGGRASLLSVPHARRAVDAHRAPGSARRGYIHPAAFF